MAEDDIFTAQPEPDLTPVIDEVKADPEKAAKRLADKDRYIKQLEEEAKVAAAERVRDEAELKARNDMEALVERLAKAQQPTSQSTPPAPQGTEPDTRGSAQVNPKPEDITKLVNDAIEQRQVQQTVKANVAKVTKRLVEVFGADYVTELRNRAAQLGVTEGELNRQASLNPRVFFKLLDIPEETEVRQQGQVRQAVRTDAFIPASKAGRKTFEDFDALRKKDPVTYRSPAIQQEMHELYTRSLQEGWDFKLPPK